MSKHKAKVRSVKISLYPKKAKSTAGTDAWWYEEEGGISVYVSEPFKQVFEVKIPRRQLKKYLERSEQ